MRASGDGALPVETSPLLSEASAGKAIRARVAGDDYSAHHAFNKRLSSGLFALVAVAVCGVLALTHGPAWHFGASGHNALGKWDQANDASARTAAASTGASQTKCNADSMSNAARSKGVFVYEPPEQCLMMVICAGSPRAASTAHCLIAKHVIGHIMEKRKADGRSKYDAPDYAGYWNYHLHAVCSDGQPCPLYDAETGDLAEFTHHISSFSNIDSEEKDALRHACDAADVVDSLDRLKEVDEKSVVMVKSHEFDKTLLNACSKRLILTSWRDKEDVFDSGLELGWFAYPKEAARDDFNEVYAVWDGWHTCWRDAAVADSETTRNHDLGFESLNNKDSFKAEVRRLAKMVIHLMSIPENEIDLDKIVADAVTEDFQEELNPMLSNGNQSPAAATGEAERPATVNWRRVGLHVD